MMKKVLWALAALVVFVVFLVVSMPARFALQFIDVPAGVQLGGVSGRIWRGEVDAVRAGDIILRDVQWRLRPAHLLSGQLRLDVVIGEHVDNLVVGQARLGIRRTQVSVSQMILEARLTDLAAYAPQPSPFPLRGDVQLRVDSFIIEQPFSGQAFTEQQVCTQANGRVELLEGAMQVGANWESLGELQATLGCEQGWVTGELLPNTLGLTAFIRMNMHQAQGEFQIHESAQAPRSVRNLVAMLPEQARRVQRFSLNFF